MTYRYLFLIIIVFTTSCERTYKYIQIDQESGMFGGTKEKEPVIIKASSDSAAYIQAFIKFCSSKSSARAINEAFGYSSYLSAPVTFRLERDGQNIAATINFIDKDKKEKEIEALTSSASNNIKKTIKNSLSKEKKQKTRTSK